jgi:hypothetical protein
LPGFKLATKRWLKLLVDQRDEFGGWEISVQRKEVLHAQVSTNCGLGCFKNESNISTILIKSQVFRGFMTAQVVDPFPLYIEFPGCVGLKSWFASHLTSSFLFPLHVACHKENRGQSYKTCHALGHIH